MITSIICDSLIKRLFKFNAVFPNSDRKPNLSLTWPYPRPLTGGFFPDTVLCCKRKVAAAKIEKLKVYIIKCYDISKTYSVQFGLRPATLLKKRFWHRCFPVNFAKFLRTPILTEHLRWLLLNIVEVWNLKSELIKTLLHKIFVTERNIAFRRKRNC